MKEPQAAGAGRGRALVGSLGSRRVRAVESSSGLLLVVVGAVAGAAEGIGSGWGALAGLVGAAAVVGGPFWAL